MGEETLEEHLESHARSVKSAKISHAILEPSRNIDAAFRKTKFRDENQLDQLSFFYTKARDAGMTEDSSPPLNEIPLMIRRKLEGLNSLGAQNLMMAVESDIGVIDQAFHQTALTGKPASMETKQKKNLGFLRRERQDNDDGDRVR